MKHLLIILISILLLSSFLISCDKKEETLYQWKTSSGYEWKTIGDKNNNPQYKGEVKREYIIFGDGFPEGLGSLTYPDGEKYVGEWKDGKNNGQGTFTYHNGTKYVGEFKDGYRNGQGTYTWSNGKKYIGKWKNGEINGQGTYTRGKGDYEGGGYVGQWKSGYKHGQGTYTYPKGSKYVGEYNDGNRWNGTEYDEDGTIIRKYVNGSITEINL